ncbi:unnamed protein product, partial [Dibothriocephalus latus]
MAGSRRVSCNLGVGILPLDCRCMLGHSRPELSSGFSDIVALSTTAPDPVNYSSRILPCQWVFRSHGLVPVGCFWSVRNSKSKWDLSWRVLLSRDVRESDDVWESMMSRLPRKETSTWLRFTPLHLAAQNGHKQTARILLYFGADVNARNKYGDTPLHTATRYGHIGIVRILLNVRADVTATNANYDTPLHIAAALGRSTIVRLLIEAQSTSRADADWKSLGSRILSCVFGS